MGDIRVFEREPRTKVRLQQRLRRNGVLKLRVDCLLVSSPLGVDRLLLMGWANGEG